MTGDDLTDSFAYAFIQSRGKGRTHMHDQYRRMWEQSQPNFGQYKKEGMITITRVPRKREELEIRVFSCFPGLFGLPTDSSDITVLEVKQFGTTHIPKEFAIELVAEKRDMNYLHKIEFYKRLQKHQQYVDFEEVKS